MFVPFFIPRSLRKYHNNIRNFTKRKKTIVLSEIKRISNELNGVESVLDRNREALLILKNALNKNYETLMMNLNLEISDKDIENINKMVELRKKDMPMAYIMNKKEFWSIEFEVNESTLIPRPETELIVSTALELSEKFKGGKILDLGTGSGCIIISLLKNLPNEWTGIGVDINNDALNVAKRNALNAGIEESRIQFILSNWGKEIRNCSFEIITSNPPYIDTNDIKSLSKTIHLYEPHIALDGGIKGLEKYSEISLQIEDLLKDDGYFIAEIGYDQEKDVLEIFHNNTKLQHIKTLKDYEDHTRCIVWKK